MDQVGKVGNSDERLEQMRRDWLLLSMWERESGRWTEEDEAQMGSEIRAAVVSGVAEQIQAWADYLAAETAPMKAMACACRAAEARIRAECAAERDRQERQAA